MEAAWRSGPRRSSGHATPFPPTVAAIRSLEPALPRVRAVLGFVQGFLPETDPVKAEADQAREIDYDPGLIIFLQTPCSGDHAFDVEWSTKYEPGKDRYRISLDPQIVNRPRN